MIAYLIAAIIGLFPTADIGTGVADNAHCVAYTDRTSEPNWAISVQVCGGPELGTLFGDLLNDFLDG